MNIVIKEVSSKKELRKFAKFTNQLYKKDAYYCPQILLDLLSTFNPKSNPAHEFSDSVYYLAYKDSKIVGRIAGIINHNANRAWECKKVRFGWFDFIDDKEVSKALLDAVAAWGKNKGMDTLNGPVGYTDLDLQGLLLEGYEYSSPLTSLYNYPYYVEHFNEYGLSKEVDWIEYQLIPPGKVPERIERIGERVLQRLNLKIVKCKTKKEVIKRYGLKFFDVIDIAYRPLYNVAPMTQAQKQNYTDTYLPLLNLDFVTFIEDKAGELIGVGIGMPDISDALRSCNGNLFPFGWWKILRAVKAKRFKVLDLLLIAILPEYQNLGVNALFLMDQIKYVEKYGIETIESSAVLESNIGSIGTFNDIERIFHKKRRAYIKTI